MFHLLNNPKYMGIAFIVIILIIGVSMMFYVKNCVKTEIDEIRTTTKKKRIILMKRHQEMMAKRMEEERRHIQMMEEKKRQEQAQTHHEEEREEDAESYMDPVQRKEDNIESFNQSGGDFAELGH